MTDSTATKARTMGARIKDSATVTEPVKAKPTRIKKAKPAGLQVSNPTEFTKCTEIKATFRKGKKDYDCKIVAIRNDGEQYTIESAELGVLTTAIEKVMITPPDPEPTEEPVMEILEAIAAVELQAIVITTDGEVAIAEQQAPAVMPATKKAALVWRTEMMDVASLPDPYKSPTQVDERMNPKVIADYANMMTADDDGFVVWQWDQEGAKPRLFWDGENYHYGDAHHRVGAAKLAGLTGIPCFVTDGTMRDAKRYSYRKANRMVGYALTDIQREELIAGVLTDWEMISEIKAEIYEATGKTEKPADIDAMPAARAIAQWLEGLTSYKTVEKVWRMMVASSSMTAASPWLKENKRLGIDGKIRKAEAPTENVPSSAPAKPIPQPADVAAAFNAYEEEPQRQDDRGPANAPSTTAPAPTTPAPAAPGMQTYTGKAAIARIAETAEAAAKQLLDRIAKEMVLKVPMSEVYNSLLSDIRLNLEYAIKGNE